MMKNLKMLILTFVIVTSLALSGCIGDDADSVIVGQTENSVDVPNSMMSTPSASGVVLETMDAPGYTYVKIDTGNGEVWAAGPQITVEVGDTVSVSGNVMNNFLSPSLGRTFDELILSDKIVLSGETADSTDSAPSPHGGN